MVQTSCTTRDVFQNPVNNGINYRSLNWWVYRISEPSKSCPLWHQRFFHQEGLLEGDFAESVQGFVIAGPAGAGGMLHIDPGGDVERLEILEIGRRVSRWQLKYLFIFIPKIGEDAPMLTHIFSNGLKPPARFCASFRCKSKSEIHFLGQRSQQTFWNAELTLRMLFNFMFREENIFFLPSASKLGQIQPLIGMH